MRHGIQGSDAVLPQQVAHRRPAPERFASSRSVASPLRIRSSRGEKGFVVTAFIAFVFGLLLIVNTLTQMGEDAYSIGRASIVVTLILPQLLLVISRPRGLRRWRHLAAPVTCFFFLSLLYYPRGVDSDDNWIPLLQVVLLGGFFTSVATFSWSSQALMLLNWIARGFILASLLCWAWLELKIPNYGPYINPNANGAALAYLFGVSLLSVRPGTSFVSKSTRVGWVTLALLAITSTVSRASLLAALTSIAVYIFWPLVCRRRSIFIATFCAPLLLVATITAFRSVLLDQAHALGFSAWSSDLTGKTLSTRSRIWEPVYSAIVERPIWGHGPDIDIAQLLNADLSSHSIYLQVALQTGLVGLSVLLFLLFRIWSTLWLGRTDLVVRGAGAFLIGMLIHEGFEVMLLQNNVALGTIVWFILGIGVARSIAADSNWPNQHSMSPGSFRPSKQFRKLNRVVANSAPARAPSSA
jgi:hypothetical protein